MTVEAWSIIGIGVPILAFQLKVMHDVGDLRERVARIEEKLNPWRSGKVP
ncbi:MAG: hypothetical protein OXR82_06530 [Gammaproteobacteria bacterium]|nr:hypothetical protein [Gammaproteobacteria bacterium]MDE0258030.1 hypothetical protein [Gammaproteobacteria bacterium]